MIRLRVYRDQDGTITLWHNAGYSVQVELGNEDPTSEHPPKLATVATATVTTLRFPSPEHEWVAVPELGDPGLTELCSDCGATRRTDPPRARS